MANRDRTASQPDATQPSDRDGSARAGEADVMAWLEHQTHADLVALLLDVADDHPDVRRDLEAQAAAAQAVPPDIDRYETELAAAFDVGGFVPWQEMVDWSSDVHAALDGLGELLDAGFADDVVRLAERGLAELEHAVGHVDDAGGQLVGIGKRLVDLHLAALRAAQAVDRREAGQRVFALAVAGELEVLPERIGEYRDALGPDGWPALCEAAQAAWDEVPTRGPGEDDPDRYGRRLRLGLIMEALAGDDLDALLAVRARSLARPFDWMRIVATCIDAGRDDLAIEWGARGVEAFGADADPRLADAVSAAYQRLGRLTDALELERRQFRRQPSTTRYRGLRAVAQQLGQWPAERRDAHRVASEHVNAAQHPGAGAAGWAGWREPPGSLLVALHLEDGDADQAWNAACAHGCSQQLWLVLAELRADAHPDDAIAVYRRRLDEALEPATTGAYDTVIELLALLQPLHARVGRPREFTDLVAEIRAGYQRRPNLIKRLDDAGL